MATPDAKKHLQTLEATNKKLQEKLQEMLSKKIPSDKKNFSTYFTTGGSDHETKHN